MDRAIGDDLISNPMKMHSTPNHVRIIGGCMRLHLEEQCMKVKTWVKNRTFPARSITIVK
jgi:hypothetical protein